jgi:serine/threonine protein kinase
LDELLATGFDAATALDLGAQIAEGLAEAHSHGLIHRDIKPANIIISEKGQAKILDFGLAKFIEAEAETEAGSGRESAGGVMGTIPYMSPEQLSGGAVDARTDVFSFGSLLFEMLSGAPAFRRERDAETISSILTDEPDWSLVSPVLRPMLARCLAKDSGERYASASELVEALDEARKNEPLRNTRPPNTVTSINAVTALVDLKTKPLYFWQSGGEKFQERLPGAPVDQPEPSRSRWRGLREIAGIILSVAALASFVYVWQRTSQEAVKPEIQQFGEEDLVIADGFLRQRKFEEAIAAYQ